MGKKWICIMMNSKFHRGDKEAAKKEIQNIFKKDLLGLKIVCDDSMNASGEYYAFMSCSNYASHVDRMVSSVAIIKVVPNYNNPDFLSSQDVKSFAFSVENQHIPGSFMYGDVVRLKEHEYLGNLIGLITKPGKKKCDVFFRFYTCSFSQLIPVTSLEYIDNVLEKVRIPPFTGIIKRSSLFKRCMVSKAREALRNIVSGDKIHWEAYRKAEQAYDNQ